jgi:hypothetical protein
VHFENVAHPRPEHRPAERGVERRHVGVRVGCGDAKPEALARLVLDLDERGDADDFVGHRARIDDDRVVDSLTQTADLRLELGLLVQRELVFRVFREVAERAASRIASVIATRPLPSRSASCLSSPS